MRLLLATASQAQAWRWPVVQAYRWAAAQVWRWAAAEASP